MVVAVLLPFVQDAFGAPSSSVDVNDLENDVTQGVNIDGGVAFLDILSSVGKMFFWFFSDLPFWLNAFFVLLRIVMIIAIIDMAVPG